jgi:hypothetical protein
VIPSPPLLRRAPRNDGLISRYEELRQQVLGQVCGIPRGQGLALLMRSGIGGWMQAWAQCVEAVPAPPKERLGDDEIFPIELHREVTMILAGMVLYGCQEAIA